MRIDWVILCRYAEMHGRTATIVGAGVDTYKVASFPAEISLGVVVRFALDHDEVAAGRESTYTVRIQGPDPTAPPESEMTDTIRGLPGGVARVGGEGHGIYPTTHIFEATEPGPHTITYVVDGAAKTVVFTVEAGGSSEG